MPYRFLLPFTGAMCSLLLAACAHQIEAGREDVRPLAVVAIGDAGEPGAELRSCAALLRAMSTGEHDGGTYEAMLFLGDNFYNTGLNVPVDEVDGYVRRVLGPYRVPFERLGRERVHAVPGNHDYYARNAIEASVLFGLISIAEGPVGLTDRGNRRAAALDVWTYHHRMPGRLTLPLAPEAPDSVQFIFVDSALPLRTDTATWSTPLDSLERLLAAERGREEIAWRVLVMHHPLRSLGEHGGYSVWNDETEAVEYLTPCDKDSNAVAWIKNLIDPEDLCAEKYRSFMTALRATIRKGGVPVHAALSGHDHSLQLLLHPDRDCPECPQVQIISGAGSKPTRVRAAAPPAEFTSFPDAPSRKGVSPPGFVRLEFTSETLRAVFFDAGAMKPLDMGSEQRSFVIRNDGGLVPREKEGGE